MTVKSKVLVVLSGGQDSTTCLFWAKQHFEEVHAITYDYGQRHARELEAARTVAALAKVESHEVMRVGAILRGASPLVSGADLEQYADHQSLPGGLEKTFVPGRNLLFFTLAANLAYSKGIVDIVTGVCQEDFGGYPDCRQDFVTSAQETIRLGLGYENDLGEEDEFRSHFTIHAPLMNLTKARSVQLAFELPGCWEALAYTHTSYDGQYPPVGHDHATLLREKGFLEAGLPDPLVLRAAHEGLMPLPKTANYSGVTT